MNFKKIIESTEATIKGHLYQERKNLRSTKTLLTSNLSLIREIDDTFSEQIKTKTQSCFYTILNLVMQEKRLPSL